MYSELTTTQLIERGQSAYQSGQHALALAYYREVVRREPGYADIHNLVGICLSLCGETDAALEAFQVAVSLNPRYVEALLNQAITLQDLGRYTEGQVAYEAASEADVEEGVGRFPAVLAGRLANKLMEVGDLYLEGGALTEAVEQFRRALELRPRFADIRNRLGRTLLEMGNGEAAVREFDRTLQINPGFLEARINLGLAWYRMGDPDRARQEWRRCEEQRPGNAQVASYLGMLERGAEASPPRP
jgi:tetratricopeptide (TPR) repeat protein